jgi:hypothetical protein
MGLSVGEEVLEFSMYLLGGRVGVYGVSLVGLVVEGGKEGVNPGFVLQTSKKTLRSRGYSPDGVDIFRESRAW